MIRILTSLGLIGLLTTGPVFADSLKRITTKDAYVAQVVGKKFGIDKKTWFRAKANGTFAGRVEGKKIKGVWEWRGKYWCRNARIAGDEIGTDCQVIKISETGVQHGRKKGRGRVADYKFMK